jgi:hypothetical protein
MYREGYMKKQFLLIGITILAVLQICEAYAVDHSILQTPNTPAFTINHPTEPVRRAMPAPFDPIFPSSEYLGPTIGVPNTDPIFPLTKLLWKSVPGLQNNDIRVYGWLNPSYNYSTSKQSNAPLSYDIVPNRPELDQLILRIERQPNTVQMDHVDWGFRVSNLYGTDYRFTTAQGYFSNQLLKKNNMYGYDPVELYAQFYFPGIAEGMLMTAGRYISPPDIEAQLSPENYLFTHSLMFTFDAYTQTGINAAVKLNNQWSIILGVHAGDDVAPWAAGKHIPTGQMLIRWVSKDNNDSLWGGVDSWNGGSFKGNHDNLQEFNLTWTHRFTERFFTTTESYYIYQRNSPLGGTCIFGPTRFFASGGGCGTLIPGQSSEIGLVNYTEYKLADKDFLSLRLDYLDDIHGERSSYPTAYASMTAGITHQFTDLIEVRPEMRYEFATRAKPYDNGARKSQFTVASDIIVRF